MFFEEYLHIHRNYLLSGGLIVHFVPYAFSTLTLKNKIVLLYIKLNISEQGKHILML